MIYLDGYRGGSGATPAVVRDNVGIPIELALAVVDQRLREEKIRHQASIVVAGGIRSSADVMKAIALGADAVAIGTACLLACGCHLCQRCNSGKCSWGIARDMLQSLQPVLTSSQVLALQDLVQHVYLEDSLLEYVLKFVEATRRHEMVELALNPRSSLSMVRAAKALALQRGRDYVLPDDIKLLCLPVFSHRLKLKKSEYYKDKKADALLGQLLEKLPLPLRSVSNEKN